MKPRQDPSPALTLFLAPPAIGLASALGHLAVQSPQQDIFYWFGPLMSFSLAGMAIALACRPVLAKLPWRRSVAIALGLGLVVGIGTPGDWIAAWLLNAAGVSGFPMSLPRSGVGLATGAVIMGVLMGLMFRPHGGEIDWRGLGSRFRFHGWGNRLGKLALLGLGVAALWLAVAWVDALLEEDTTRNYLSILEPIEPNYWYRLQGVWQRQSATSGAGGAAILLAVIWLRAVLLTAPLLPIALAIRGSRLQLTLVFTILLFVLGEFAPLLRDPAFSSLNWLLLRIALGLARSAVVALAVVALFGVIRREAPRSSGGPD
ncbi:MAG: hypothetical protein V3S64_06225 [bacterium]